MLMHPRQIRTTEATVAQMVAEQFPRWRGLPVRRIASNGTVNAIFRLGDSLVARLPLLGDDPGETLRELRAERDAAERIGRATRVATPEFVALGEPCSAYPLPWAVCRWIPGTPADRADVSESTAFAEELAHVVREIRAIDTGGRSFRGTRRGGLLGQHDGYVARSLAKSRDMIDTAGLERLWNRLRQSPRTEPDIWTHGDLMPGNLLVGDGRLIGLIDVGQAAVADPALDLQPAWNLLGPRARYAFRRTLEVDDAAWDRGKGWALAQAIGCLWYYRETNPVMSATARTTLLALLADDDD